jgi:pSer/pThr/pTyr-binding forkhead associated (FHA) protein
LRLGALGVALAGTAGRRHQRLGVAADQVGASGEGERDGEAFLRDRDDRRAGRGQEVVDVTRKARERLEGGSFGAGHAAALRVEVAAVSASTRHARISPRDGDWVVEDLGSTNGTDLDRSKVTTAVRVPIGTAVHVGKTVIELRP